MPQHEFPGSDDITKQRAADWEDQPAIQTVRLPGRFFLSQPLHTPVPAAISKKTLDVTMPSGAATLDDLIVILENEGLSISYSWDTAANADDIGAKRLPFRRFKGTVGELLARLQMGMSIASWWNNNTLYLAPVQRYTVKVPQNDEIIGVVEGQLESLGAQDIVSSLYAGQVTYSASPEANEELISPFLHRLGLNLSEITLQVALVRVSMNEASRRGFDWKNFNLSFTKNVPFGGTSSSNNSSNSSSTTGTTDSTGTVTGVGGGFVPGTVTVRPSGSQYNVGASSLTGLGMAQGVLANDGNTGANSTSEGSGGIAGIINTVPGLVAEATIGHLSLSSAINFLSSFGTTSTDQNVELRTLAGQAVHIRDGGETPYISQITSNTTTGGNTSNNSNSVEFETVDTGLTLDLTPNFDAASGIVTVDVSLAIEDIESFLSIPSGSSFGNIERPVTSNRELTDIVRVPAGYTVVLGGVTKISKSDNRSAPLEYWTFGNDDMENDRTALFIILRPIVTVYELDGNEMTPDPVSTITSAEPPVQPVKPQPGPAATIVDQNLTKPGNVPGPVRPLPSQSIVAPPPNRPTASAEPPVQSSPTSLATGGSDGSSSGYFNNLVGKILVQPSQK